MVDQLNGFASEVTRVAPRGRHRGQARRPGTGARRCRHVEGPDRQREPRWPANLTAQVRNIAEVTTAGARATSPRRSPSTLRGEILELKNTINTMVDQLNGFASEVTRVAREVGTEGKLGGQAPVPGRRRHVEGPHRQREFLMATTSPARCATSPDVTTAVALRRLVARRSPST